MKCAVTFELPWSGGNVLACELRGPGFESFYEYHNYAFHN